MRNTLCRVCGWDFGEEPWSGGAPQYLICDCCGAESGVDDRNERLATRYLRWWIDRGCAWTSPTARPPGWGEEVLRTQLATVGRDLDEVLRQPVPRRWKG